MLETTLKIGLSLLLLALPCGLAAANIYKYQDENGIWHFTDRAPADDIEFETVYMEREPEPRVRLRQVGSRQNPVYALFNEFWGPVQVELTLQDASNVLTEPELPARFVVPGQTESTLLGVGALDPRRGFKYRLTVASVPGPPMAEPIAELVLRPPFASGEAYPVSQGFRGERTHKEPDSEYAIDIGMPLRTAVHAARGGVVMDVEEDFNSGGIDLEKYGDKANHVRILHDDGSMAMYAHLDLASVNVRPGARVRAGEKIARSGNTGFSSGPHLHFVVQQNTGMRLISLPFRFRLPDGTLLRPEEGRFIGAPQPPP